MKVFIQIAISHDSFLSDILLAVGATDWDKGQARHE